MNTPNIHTAHNQHHNKRDTTIDLAITTEDLATKDFISLSVSEAPVQGKHHHSLIVAYIKTSIKDHPITNQKTLAKCNWEKFRARMNGTCKDLSPPPATTSIEDLDSHITKFTKEVARNLWDSCPTKKRHHGLHRVSTNLLQKIKTKHTLQRLSRDNPNIPHLKHQLNTIRREISQELAQEKDNRLQREIASMDPRKSKSFWKTFNEAIRTNKKDKQQVTLTNPATGIKTATNKENATIFANHLKSVHRTHRDHYTNHNHKQEIDTWTK